MTDVCAAKLEGRVYFAVPFVEKERAQKLGGQWDVARGAWFVQDDANLEEFARWRRLEVNRSGSAYSMSSQGLD